MGIFWLPDSLFDGILRDTKGLTHVLFTHFSPYTLSDCGEQKHDFPDSTPLFLPPMFFFFKQQLLFIFLFLFIYFIYGCVGSLFLCEGFL